jgi:hypothetical protein
LRQARLLVLAAIILAGCGDDRKTALPRQRPPDFALTYEDRSPQHKRHVTLRIVGDKAELIDHIPHPSVVRDLRVTASQIDELYGRLYPIQVETIRTVARRSETKPLADVAIAIRWENSAVSIRENAREGPAKEDADRFGSTVGYLLVFVRIWGREHPPVDRPAR